jgi:bacteriocin-like protein
MSRSSQSCAAVEIRTTRAETDPDRDRADDDGELSDEQLATVIGGLLAWSESDPSAGRTAGEPD